MMKERPQPYIGISGVVDRGQQYYLMDQFVWNGLDEPPINRQIALGVKNVHKTQFLDIENKYGTDWYPVGEEAFANALSENGIRSLRVAQMYFDAEEVQDPEYRKAFVERTRRRGRAWLNTFQFDMLPWHKDETMLLFLEEVKDETGHAVILQAHGEAMSELGPEGIARQLGRYAHALDYILFDASHGRGVRMDTEKLVPFLDASYSNGSLQNVGIGIAGGLNAEVVRNDLPVVIELFPDVSWDAEGQLHPFRPDGTRPIDMTLAKRYLEASREVLEKVY
jgi:phosphoribosylanthranilate isomerase